MIIGLTGTLGSGKGEIAKYLTSLGFVHYSVTDYLIKEIQARNMPVNRDSMFEVANDLRRTEGAGILAKRLLAQAFSVGHTNIVVESIRNPKEIDELKQYPSSFLIAVDADITIRYERISLRKSSKDSVSFEAFKQQELQELNDPSPHVQKIAQCMERADICINNERSIDDLKKQVDSFLASHNFNE